MKRNIRQTLLAPVVLLLAAATLGLAGCTQGDDTLPGAGGNDAARSLNINVGPKQGFTPGSTDSNTPGTRSTVDESTGAMEWQEGDRIFLYVTYAGSSAKGSYTMVRNAATWDCYEGYVGTHDQSGNAIDLSALTSLSGIPVPLEATAITQIIAYHTDNDTYWVSGHTVSLKEGGSYDMLRQVIDNPDMNADITLELRHAVVTRLYFPGGLTPGKKYYLDGLSSIAQMVINQTMAIIKGGGYSFTAAPDGSLAICIGDYTGSQTVTLKEKDTDKIVYTATFNIEYGKNYQCIIPTSGGIDPDNNPDLLNPVLPIVPGNKVYEVNGYFVTAPEADPAKTYTWDAANNATTGLCVGHGDWRMPTMKDFEKMLSYANPPSWTDSPDGKKQIDVYQVESEYTIWQAAFPYYDGNAAKVYYWSSDSHQNGDQVWSLLHDVASGYAYYSIGAKTNAYNVRCVQPQ